MIEQVGPDNTARCRHPVTIEVTGHSAFDTRHQLELLALRTPRPTGGVFGPSSRLALPWIVTAGSVPDDTLTDDWLESVAEYRQQFDPPTELTPAAQFSQPAF